MSFESVKQTPDIFRESSGSFFNYLGIVEMLEQFTNQIKDSILVDPASSHMLVSKTKPCMSKYKHLYTAKLRTAHYISYNLLDRILLLG